MTITIRQLLEKFIPENEQEEGWANLENFCISLGITNTWNENKFNERMKKYWLVRWLCTDTHVGTALYTFNGKVVAISTQTARRSDENIEWLSLECATEVREFILSLEEYHTPSIVNLDEEVQLFENQRYVTWTNYYSVSPLVK